MSLTLPHGKRLTGIAVSEGSSAVSVQLAAGQDRYVGRRRVVLTVQGRGSGGGIVTAYAYGR